MTAVATAPAPLLARQLADAGKTPAVCPIDGTVFDPRVSYSGHRTNRARVYCRETCKADARNARARAERAADPAGVRRMRREERRGQLAIPGSVELPPAVVVDPLA